MKFISVHEFHQARIKIGSRVTFLLFFYAAMAQTDRFTYSAELTEADYERLTCQAIKDGSKNHELGLYLKRLKNYTFRVLSEPNLKKLNDVLSWESDPCRVFETYSDLKACNVPASSRCEKLAEMRREDKERREQQELLRKREEEEAAKNKDWNKSKKTRGLWL